MGRIKVQIYNDGKEDFFSYEASLKHTHQLSSFGKRRKDEAIQVLKDKVKKRINQLQNIDWENPIRIDGMGNILTN